MLLNHFLSHFARRNGLPAKTITPGAMQRLSSLPWHGNVREIHNVAERLLILGHPTKITEQDVLCYVHGGAGRNDTIEDLIHRYENLGEFRNMAEKLFLTRMLRDNDWNISRTAQKVGIQRSNLYSKIRAARH